MKQEDLREKYIYIYRLLQELDADNNHSLWKWTNQSENVYVNRFLFQIDNALKILYGDVQDFKNWFDVKKKSLTENDVDISSVLGEFRAFYHLYKSNICKHLTCSTSNGSDFLVNLNDQTKINIEVNTPLGASENRVRDLGMSQNGNIKTEMKEVATFGLPERNIDTYFSEFCSAINNIKQDEHQFQKDAINILWVDMVNPYLEEMNIYNKNLCEPFTLFNGQIHAGDIFFSLYSKKNDSIPVDFALDWGTYRDYKLEYDCKLINQKSIVDFIVFNLYDGLFVFENIYSHGVKKTNVIYNFLYSMDIKIEASYLNYPQEDLICRIQKIKNDVLKYKYLKDNI